MFNMESWHLLNFSVQNALDCISETPSISKILEKCAVRSPHGRYRANIATVYYISRLPLSQNLPSAPVNGKILICCKFDNRHINPGKKSFS